MAHLVELYKPKISCISILINQVLSRSFCYYIVYLIKTVYKETRRIFKALNKKNLTNNNAVKMMKLVILLCFIVCAAADFKHPSDRNSELFKYNPSDVYTLPEDIDDEKPAVIFEGNVMRAKVEKLQNFNGNKKFKLDLKTQNGIEVTSVGKLKDDKTFVVSGSYSFTGADGKRYKTRYTADEFGYHPITELDLDIPDPQPIAAATNVNKFDSSNKDLLGGLKNRFQFLNQNLNLDISGSAQSGDDYRYSATNNNGYSYEAPIQQFESAPSIPSREYLPVK